MTNDTTMLVKMLKKIAVRRLSTTAPKILKINTGHSRRSIRLHTKPRITPSASIVTICITVF